MSDDTLTETPTAAGSDMLGSVLSRLSSSEFEEESDEDTPANLEEEDEEETQAEQEEEEVESVALMADEAEGIDD
ncbi:MAG: hypothetical protein AB7T37_14235, partial [Dehalococcoidia bacterium]